MNDLHQLIDQRIGNLLGDWTYRRPRSVRGEPGPDGGWFRGSIAATRCLSRPRNFLEIFCKRSSGKATTRKRLSLPISSKRLSRPGRPGQL